MQKTFSVIVVSVLSLSACSTNKPTTVYKNAKSEIGSEIRNPKPEICQRYQQHVDYTMNVDFDDAKNQYTGTTHLVYTNNSPDALNKAFFHLYPNAFQPGSAMDVRSLNIEDPDPRVGSRISKLKPDEIGYLNVTNLKLNGKSCITKVDGTILEVILPEKIAPNSSVTFDFSFSGQESIQIRRSGRNNAEGVDYSMSQWYPKLCEYDEQGWHSNPYIAREFYGVWGDFDVNIKIDPKFTLFGSGILQNPNEIGKGYAPEVKLQMNKKINWHFNAKKVHDFMWAADSNYKHVTQKADDGTLMHFFYIPSDKTKAWEQLPDIMAKVFAIARDRYGKYPYTDFSFVQGGDGGMEYPMSTLITGERPLNSLVGVAAHEMMHSWYQGVLATNESLYPWMDEGFTTFAESYIQNVLKEMKLMGDAKPVADPMKKNVENYCRFAVSGKEEALSTHADHYNTNTAYGVGSYTKGSVFLQQIKYIVGEENFNKGMLKYFDEWQFRHPNANDFIRVQEKNADIKLDWFREYFVNTTKTIDYAVGDVKDDNGKTKIELKRISLMIMPIDVTVTYTDGKKELFYIPLDLMRGEKPIEDAKIPRTLLPDWTWTFPTYSFSVPKNLTTIKSIEIDASGRMADVNRANNVFSK